MTFIEDAAKFENMYLAFYLALTGLNYSVRITSLPLGNGLHVCSSVLLLQSIVAPAGQQVVESSTWPPVHAGSLALYVVHGYEEHEWPSRHV